MNDNKITLQNEIVRFLISGILCAIADFLVTSLFLGITKNLNPSLQSFISLLCGFIVGVILNYLLSTFWVFKGVNNSKKTKGLLFIILFVFLSAIAYGLSYGTYELCRILFSNIDNSNINDINFSYIIKFTFWGNKVFWFYAISFVLKTLVGLIWNYFTRKYILYKNKNA